MGTTELAVEFAVEISQRRPYGVNVIGLVGDQVADPGGVRFLGEVDMIQALVEQTRPTG